MAGEAAVSDSISLAWAASLASIAVAVVYKRDPRSATPWGLLISGGTASRSLAIRLRDGAARLFT